MQQITINKAGKEVYSTELLVDGNLMECATEVIMFSAEDVPYIHIKHYPLSPEGEINLKLPPVVDTYKIVTGTIDLQVEKC